MTERRLEPPSAAARIEDALERAEELRHLGAFWSLGREDAIARAVRVDRGGGRGALAGVPFAVKDIFDVAGHPTSAGLAGDHSPATRDAELVTRLGHAGAVPIGKTAMDPLGITTSGQAPGFPPCLNPVDPSLSPGGSSSGSAAAVGAGIVPLALGSDTAGSVRIPASFCGVAALKPAPGRLSRGGMVAVMGKWDVPGVIAKTLDLCVSGLRALGGLPQREAGRGTLRVGLLSDLFAEADREVARQCQRVIAQLGPRCSVEPVELGFSGRGYGALLAAEFERRWGRRVDSRPEQFGELVRDMVERARARSPERLEAIRAALRDQTLRVERRLGALDAVISPTVPVPPPARDQEKVEESTRFARPFNALGWPAASVPAGRSSQGSPIGVQVSAAGRRLPEMLVVAAELERSARRG